VVFFLWRLGLRLLLLVLFLGFFVRWVIRLATVVMFVLVARLN
jgi:hypothetical protein